MNVNEVNLLIDEMYDIIQGARALPLFADRCVVERDQLLDLLDSMISVLPENIKQAQSIVASRSDLISQAKREAESCITSAQSQASNTIASANHEADRVRTSAKIEAENIIKAAKAQAQELVSQESVYKEAEKQSKEMIDKTNAQLTELKATSYKYMADALKSTSATIEASLKSVNDIRTRLEASAKIAPTPQSSTFTPIYSHTGNQGRSFADKSFVDIDID